MDGCVEEMKLSCCGLSVSKNNFAIAICPYCYGVEK
jgi:hypothetical protein